MIELLTTYSLQDIVMFLAMFIGACCAAVKAWHTLNDEYQLVTTKRVKELKEKETEAAEREENLKRLSLLEESVGILLESDTCRIRGEIVREYRHFSRLGYIDETSLNYLQKQYAVYSREGGNSYVSQIMRELNSLPLGDTVAPTGNRQ